VADFDGDGQAEIGWGENHSFYMYELDGTAQWTQTFQTTSSLAGCSGFDVDGDGAYEALFADEENFGTDHFRRQCRRK